MKFDKKKLLWGTMGARLIEIPRNVLENLYVKRGMTAKEIGKLFYCSADTVFRRLDDYGIPRRSRYKDLPVEELYTLYTKQHLSTRELAEKYNCSHTTICNRLGALDLLPPSGLHKSCRRIIEENQEAILHWYEARKTVEWIATMLGVSKWAVLRFLHHAGKDIRHGYHRYPVDIETIIFLYVEQKLTVKEIAGMMGLKEGLVTARLEEAGVKIRGHHLELDIIHIKHLYEQGKNISQIAEELGCSYISIQRRLKKLGVYHKRKCNGLKL